MQNGSYSNDTAYGRLHNICRGAGMGFKDATILIDEVIAANKAKLCEKHAEDDITGCCHCLIENMQDQIDNAGRRGRPIKPHRSGGGLDIV